jgi:hypothetical protein
MRELSAILTVPQLARMANVSRYRMARALAHAGVPFRRLGKDRRIYLSDLRALAPDLWLSIREYQDSNPE